MDTNENDKKKKPYKRRMTDKRRDQNRAAQKAYRARRKERMEHLEQQVTTLQQRDQDPGIGSSEQEPLHDTSQAEVDAPGLDACDLDLFDTNPSLSNSETPIYAFRQLLKLDDTAKVNELIEFALKDKPDLSRVILAGLQTLKSESDGAAQRMIRFEPELWPMVTMGTPPTPVLPDPVASGIFFRRQSALEVVFHNCRQIGVRFEDMTKPTCQSPWYSPLPSFPSAIVPLDSVPPDLYPTPAQRRFPHHPFMDIIPFPWLRERAISMAALENPPYQWYDLKADILSGGMTCWKSRAGEEGLPWDRRSWEVQPWFWKKWSWLIEEQGKVEQQTRWWRAARGGAAIQSDSCRVNACGV